MTPRIAPPTLVPRVTPLGGVPAPKGAGPEDQDASLKAGVPHSTVRRPLKSRAGSSTPPEGSATPGKYRQAEVLATRVRAGLPVTRRSPLKKKLFLLFTLTLAGAAETEVEASQ